MMQEAIFAFGDGETPCQITRRNKFKRESGTRRQNSGKDRIFHHDETKNLNFAGKVSEKTQRRTGVVANHGQHAGYCGTQTGPCRWFRAIPKPAISFICVVASAAVSAKDVQSSA